MGPAYGRDPRDAQRRSRCGSLATLPRVAFRPPPLTPAQPAERLRSMASRSRHRSAVVAGLGLSRRVAERRRATLPRVASPRRRFNRRSPARARVALATGSLQAGNRDAHAGALRALGLSLAGHVALGQFGPSTPASPISPRGEFSNPPGAPEIYRARYRNGDTPC